MHLKKVLGLVLLVVMLFTVVGAASACSDPETTTTSTTSKTATTTKTTTTTTTTTSAVKAKVLRMAIPSPKGDSVVNNAEKFVEEFNAKAGGKYVIEIHPGESIVKFADSLTAVASGAVEMDLWPVDFFSSVDPNFAAASIPFLVNGVEADAAFGVAMMPEYEKILVEKFNCKPVYVHTLTGMDLISTKEVNSLEDWEGLLVHSISPQLGNMIDLLGGAPVSMPFSDAYQGLQKGIVEASVISTSQMVTYKMYEVADYVYTCYMTPSAALITINLDVWNSMPSDIQELLLSCGRNATKATNDAYINDTKTYSQILADNGMTVAPVSAANRAAWAEVLQPYVDELFGQMDPAFAAKVKEIAAAQNALYPYEG